MGMPTPSTKSPDVVLIAASIMSTTLALILKELDPKRNIEIHEVLGTAGARELEQMEQRWQSSISSSFRDAMWEKSA